MRYRLLLFFALLAGLAAPPARAQAPNTWTAAPLATGAVPDLPGTAPRAAVAVTINGRAFAGLGRTGNTFPTDWHEYLPASNSWVARAAFPDAGRFLAVGVAVGSVGYDGTGNTGTSALSDWWAYDPATDTWTARTAFSGAGHLTAAAFVVGGRAYVGTGQGLTGNLTDFFAYASDPPPTVMGLNPTRNLRNAAASASVDITFDQPMSGAAASAASIKVFSHQRGGRMSGAQGGAATVSGNTITFDPTTDFRPGETVFVSTTTAAQSSAGANLAAGHIHQFTTAAGAGPGNFSPVADLTVGSLPRSVAVGDVDADGDLDLLTANSGDGTVGVRLNNGAGAFSGTVGVPAGSQPYSVALGDVDGDGDLDFVAASDQNSNNVSVRLNDGTGTFGGGSTVTAGRPRCVVLGDVDGDGDLDLLTASYSNVGTGSLVSVRFNNGSGTFGGGSDYGVGIGPRSVAVADLDGDGDLDFVATTNDANIDVNRVAVWRNNGTGTFSPDADYNVGSNPRNVAIGDIDGDGDLDLLTANSGSNSGVGVFLNNGSGTFSAGTPVALSDRPAGVAAADVDGDGDLDLLTSNYQFYTVSVARNAGNGTFGAATTVSVNGDAHNLAVGDLDGDGDLDFLSVGLSGSLVSVLLNQPPAPTLASLSPTSAPVGTSITLTGTDFTGATAVSFNGTAATTFSVTTATTATATVPAGTTSGSVTITTPSGTSNGVAFTVITNQAPTAVGLSPQSVAENTASGTAIGNFSTTDPDAGDTHTYSLVSGAGSTDNGAFSINGSGQLVITAAPDYETQPNYAIRVRSTDQESTFFEQTFTISVTNVNEAPAISPQTFTIDENSANGTVVGTVGASDPDAGQSLTYSMVPLGGAGNAFVINATTGQLTVNDQAALDFEISPGFGYLVTVTDNGAPQLSNSAQVIINLNDLNENAPDLTVSSPQTIPGGSYHNVTITGTGVGTLGGDVTIQGTLLVQNGGKLDDGCFLITGPGNFTLAAGAALDICSEFGITASGALGTVQVTGTRTFSRAASYRYDSPTLGSGASTGNGLPNRVRDLTAATSVATLFLTNPTSVRRLLTIAGPVNFNTSGRALTLLSDADSTALVVNASTGRVLGTVTVQRYISPASNPGVGYRHFAAPVSNTTVADLNVTGFTARVNAAYNALPYVAVPANQFPNVFGFDETRGGATAAYQGFNTGWYSPTATTDPLTSGRGYTVAMAGGLTPDFVGTLTTGNVPLTLTRTGAGTGNPNTEKSGWGLTGNPYAAPIDWDEATASIPAGMSASISVFRSTGLNSGQYLTYLAPATVGGTGVGTLPGGLVPMGQGFFTRVLPGNESVGFTFTNALRVISYANPTHFRPAADARPLLGIRLQQAGAANAVADEALVFWQEGATGAVDAAYDAPRPGRNLGAVPTLAVLAPNGEELAIAGLAPASFATAQRLPLLAVVPAAGPYTLTLAQAANLPTGAVSLYDALTNTTHPLAAVGTTYTFTAPQAGEVAGRFWLQVAPATAPLGTGAAAAETAVLHLWPNPATSSPVQISLPTAGATGLTVTDALGRVVRTQALTPDQRTVTLAVTGLPAGVYVVRAGRAAIRLVVE